MVDHEDDAVKPSERPSPGSSRTWSSPARPLTPAGMGWRARRSASRRSREASQPSPRCTRRNPGILTHRQELLAVPTGIDVTEMRSIVDRMARLGLKVASGQELGPAMEDDYIPRGFRKPAMRDKTGAEAAIDMLEARVADSPFVSEVYRRDYDPIPAPAAIGDLSCVTIALISTGGLVPMGNPDHLEQAGRPSSQAGTTCPISGSSLSRSGRPSTQRRGTSPTRPTPTT